MDFIRNFNQITKDDAQLAGGKGASLGEMTRAGIPVPPGFVILSNAFERFLEETDLNVEIDSVLHSVNHKEIHTVEDASEKIKALILDAKMPIDIGVEIKKFFINLKAKYVAVRSSATAEDSATAAWAGQLESYLNTTEEDLLDNVKKCWASLFTPRAIFYRFEKGLHKQKISVAVVVQKMIGSEKSGVAFSVHPVTQDYNQLIIEAGFGLGEAIVSGQITPDSYVVEKQPRRIIDKNVEEQSRGLYRVSGGGNDWQDIPKENGEKQTLTDKEILELSEIVLKIENHYGFPVDIEWAYEKTKFYIVQSRPITTLRKTDSLKKKFTKEHAREYSLFRVATWYKAMNQELPKIIGASVEEACAVYRGKGLVEIYYEPIELKKLFGAVMQSSIDKNRMLEKIKDFLSNFERLKKYFTEEKYIKSVEELKKFQEQYASVWAYIGIVFMIPILPVDEELKKLAYKARSQTQEYNETPEIVFAEFMEKTFPTIKDGARFVLPEEIWNGEVEGESEDIFSKIAARKKGFIFYKNKIFTGDLVGNLEKLGIVLEEKESVVSGKAEVTGNEIKGQIANKGQVSGMVKIVSSIKDLPKVKEGDILVAAMTMPKYLPAMKKAAAFVTDEGGLTSHAAIVSRELGKPCIVGTKVATKVLKDGDLVEVDADNGVVKILRGDFSKQITTSAPRQETQEQSTDYVRMFGSTGMPFLINSIALEHYKELKAIAIFKDNLWTAFLPKLIQETTLKDGVELFGNKNNSDKYTQDFNEYKKRSTKFFEAIISKEKISKEELSKFFDLISELWLYYRKTEFFYVDGAYRKSQKDKMTAENLKHLEEIKNSGREHLNKMIFGSSSYLTKVIALVGKQFDVDIDSLFWSSKMEILTLYDKVQIDISKIKERKDAYVFLIRNGNLITFNGAEAKNFISSFVVKESRNVIKGVIANPGKVKGRVKVLFYGADTFDKVAKMMKEMKEGDILVAETTSPEIMSACKKASAILTNQGGLLSHAAIVSRELKIPCIVGLGDITHIVKDNDEVEVDANNGIVKIIKRIK